MSSICRIFTKSAARPIHSIHCDVLQSVCLSINVLKPCFTVDWIHLVKECIANIDIHLDIFAVLPFQWFVLKKFQVLGSLQTCLLCIVGELAEGGSVAVAVSVTHETQNVKSYTWHVTCHTWHLTPDTWYYSKFFPSILFVSVCFSIGTTICPHWEI